MNASPSQDVHPLDWQDDFGPCRYTELAKFVSHMQRIEREQDPQRQYALCRELGYADEPHFQRVRATFLKYWGDPNDGDTLREFVWKEPEFSQALMDGTNVEREEQLRRAMAQNPGLLAPQENLSLEAYAGICARIAGRTDVDAAEMQRILAPFSIDLPAWQRINQGWVARMRGDGTGTIAAAYSKAFMAAQAAAGEPIPLEKYAEITVAMGAWAKEGKDANAMTQRVFGVDGATLVRAMTYWGQRMSQDVGVLGRYGQLQDSFKAKYASVDPDADLKL